MKKGIVIVCGVFALFSGDLAGGLIGIVGMIAAAKLLPDDSPETPVRW